MISSSRCCAPQALEDKDLLMGTVLRSVEELEREIGVSSPASIITHTTHTTTQLQLHSLTQRHTTHTQLHTHTREIGVSSPAPPRIRALRGSHHARTYTHTANTRAHHTHTTHHTTHNTQHTTHSQSRALLSQSAVAS